MPKKTGKKTKKIRKTGKKTIPSVKKRSRSISIRRKAKKTKSLKSLSKEPSNGVQRTRIKVIGIGGGGGSIVSEIAPQVKKVNFIVANVDFQALKTAARTTKRFQFGENLTHGLGCGMNPELGRQAAEDCKEKIKKELEGSDFCILVACLGGGTGSGAGPVFAEIARSLKKKSFGIFTLPFKFEGEKRAQIAKESLEKLRPNLNVLTVIPNDKIFQIIDEKTPLKEALSAVNKLLAQSLRGLIEMIYTPGLINIDYADLKTILEGRGKLAYLSSAEAQGANRTEEALQKLLHSPLNEYNIQGAERILFNITASKDLGMLEVEQISKTISGFNKSAKIIFGISENKKYNNKIRITLLAVGCGKEKKAPTARPRPSLKRTSKKKIRVSAKQSIKPKKKSTRRIKPLIKKEPVPPKSLKRKQKKEQTGGGQVPIPPPEAKTTGQQKKKTKTKKKVSGSTPVKPEKEEKEAGSQPKTEVREPLKTENQQENEPSTTSPPPNEVSPPKRVRRNALEIKKEVEQVEREILEEEKKWDVPAFLRKRTKT